jgi:peroxiredoxin
MRGWRVRITSLCAIAVLVGFVAFLVSRPVDQGAIQVNSPLLGTRAPALTATTLKDGSVSLGSLRGRVVVLSFVASWCAACNTEAPELATYAWHVRAAHTPATILGVVYNDADAAVASFANHYGLTFPLLADPGGTVANDFAVASPPVTIVLGPTGRVAAVLQGPVTSRQLVALTDRTLQAAP